jgi:ABC-2 type transport system ATP-binding protein
VTIASDVRMTSDIAIEVRGLRKSYGDVDAVRGIDLSVREGEVFALLGPNGAGKTTTVEILEGFRDRTEGYVRVLGRDPARGERELKSRIGIVLQSTGIDPYLTVAETVDLFRAYYPRPRPVDEVIDVVGLTEKRDTRVLKLSGGQQRRLDVAIALAGDPSLLFLDEPTTGFDPAARRGAWQVVNNLVGLGKTIFLTTHYMDEAQYLAHRVAVIAKGRIVAEGPPASLGGRDTAATRISFVVPAGIELPAMVAPAAEVRDGMASVRTEDPTRVLHELTGWALERGFALEALHVSRPSLEDVYLELTGNESGTEEAVAAAPRGRRRRR